jgi:hypothetical protein
VAKPDWNRQAKSVRSEAKEKWSWRGWGCGARGSSPVLRLSTETPEREQRFGLISVIHPNLSVAKAPDPSVEK